MKKCVVLGSGIQGLSAAYYLSEAGHQVTIIDPHKEYQGASWVNAGYLTPSHIITIANPKTLANGIKWMFRSDSPFYMKPRWEIDFIRWLWEFYRSATPEKVANAIGPIEAINLLSKQCYEKIHQELTIGTFQLDQRGLLMLYETTAAEKSETAVALRAQSDGLGVSFLDRHQLEKIQPGINKEVKGAIHYTCDAHTTPPEIMRLLTQHLKNKGVSWVHDPLDRWEVNQDRITAIHTTTNTYKADYFVVAAGVWSKDLLKRAGIHLSLEAGKGYSMDVHRPHPIKYPAILMEPKCAITPMEGWARFAGTMELSGNNHRIRPERVKAIASAVSAYYDNFELNTSEMEQARCGLRPVSPDGLPLIGPTEKYPNLMVATGHAMMGWSLGPGTGKLIQQCIDQEPTSIDLTPFNPNRTFY
jgi:D-amino-acid dehydrogenase